MEQYLNLMAQTLYGGQIKEDRTGTGTISVFSPNVQYYDLSAGFPLVTTKKIHWKSVVHELLWFISGDTNVKYLQDNGVRIWNEWAAEDGELGPVYGSQWAKQLDPLIANLKSDPHSRRHIIDCWQVCDLDKMALPPCHMLIQFYVNEDNKLDMMLYQRSADIFLGVPFNIASYALFIKMIAQVCGFKEGRLYHHIGDAHIYLDHMEQVSEQLLRVPKQLPTVTLNPDITDIHDFTFDDITLEGYDPHPLIKGKVSV